MSFPPTSLAQIDSAIQAGRGAAASVLGQAFNVYRVTSGTSGQVVSGTPLYANFPAILTHWKSAKDIENTIFDILAFAVGCDNSYLNTGDILVGLGPEGYRDDGAMYVIADVRPLKQTIAIRCEQPATLTRPTTSTSNLTLNATTPTQIKTYSGVTKSTELTLTLTNGSYSFQESGTAATIPFGLQPLNRLREEPPSKLPTDTKREHFLGFLPLLSGVIVEENDVISSGSAGDRYRVEQNSMNEYGLQGQVLLLEKLTV